MPAPKKSIAGYIAKQVAKKIVKKPVVKVQPKPNLKANPKSNVNMNIKQNKNRMENAILKARAPQGQSKMAASAREMEAKMSNTIKINTNPIKKKSN